jgi:hypothetical protein
MCHEETWITTVMLSRAVLQQVSVICQDEL